MIEDNAPIANLRQVFLAWLGILALVLSGFGGTVPTPVSLAVSSLHGLSDSVAQDKATTLTATSKAARALGHRPGQDPDEFVVPVSPTALPKRVELEDVEQRNDIPRIVSGKGLPQSRAPPLT